MYPAFRALLFHLDPERAHALSLGLMRLAGAMPPARALLRALFSGPDRPVHAFGLDFRNPIGLAAGYDKDGLGWRGLACLGFGHLELGTVTPRPQPGNTRPRLFRIPAERAIINRMGFPGLGADFLAQRLSGPRPEGLVIGVNIGKSKDTPLAEAARDYLSLLRRFAPLADYLAINVSSPNTAGLRDLQARAELEALLRALAGERQRQAEALRRPVPLLVKLAPDLGDDALDDALSVILATGMDGVIATNTTIRRDGLASPLGRESGGLSGAPLTELSTAMIRKIHIRTDGQLPIIGTGGVMDVATARAKLDAGASLLQVYTGLVYAGPSLVRQILLGLAEGA